MVKATMYGLYALYVLENHGIRTILSNLSVKIAKSSVLHTSTEQNVPLECNYAVSFMASQFNRNALIIVYQNFQCIRIFPINLMKHEIDELSNLRSIFLCYFNFQVHMRII